MWLNWLSVWPQTSTPCLIVSSLDSTMRVFESGGTEDEGCLVGESEGEFAALSSCGKYAALNLLVHCLSTRYTCRVSRAWADERTY